MGREKKVEEKPDVKMPPQESVIPHLPAEGESIINGNFQVEE